MDRSRPRLRGSSSSAKEFVRTETALERYIRSCEQSFACRLPRDGAQGCKRIGQAGNACAYASVGIANQHPALFINRRVNKVEQVAVISAGGASKTDRASLDGIGRRGVYQRPGRAAVVS